MDCKFNHFCFIQIEKLQFDRDQLFFSGLSSEVQPLPPERAGAEWKQPAGFRHEAAVWFSGESRLHTGDSEVSRVLESVPAGFNCIVMNTVVFSQAVRGGWWQTSGLDTKTDRETTVSQSEEPQACCHHVFEWMQRLLLCSCLQEIKLDYSWQHHKMYRDNNLHSSKCCSISVCGCAASLTDSWWKSIIDYWFGLNINW